VDRLYQLAVLPLFTSQDALAQSARDVALELGGGKPLGLRQDSRHTDDEHGWHAYGERGAGDGYERRTRTH